MEFVVITPNGELRLTADRFRTDGGGSLELVTGDTVIAMFAGGGWSGVREASPRSEHDRVYHNRRAVEFAKAVQTVVGSESV